MKQAKKRLLPSAQMLIRSTPSATRAARKAIAFVDASNRRIARMERRADTPFREKNTTVVNRRATGRPRYRLEDLMAQIPPGTRFEEFDVGPPVGREVL